MSVALNRFSPRVSTWFKARYGSPTEVQRAAWPVIGTGKDALITAPTGSGKTLTAFLWAIDGFLAGRLDRGATRILYVSPLKALNNDIHRNLLTPLNELAAADGPDAIRVGVRSGDTSSAERRRLLRQPPELLITTPESLNILLTTATGQLALNQISTVILDEIHALIDQRRGVQLLTAVERLQTMTGTLQRIALSATVTPLEAVARYVAGCDSLGRDRSMTIVAPASQKALELSVRFPAASQTMKEPSNTLWDPLASTFREHIYRNRSTLFFANSRRLAEKIAYKLNEHEQAPIAFAHHGSLARELRHDVEARMKAGTIQAIVATSSLEMGIDIGALDEVIMVQTPPSISAGLQRLGRAGHQVGAVSRGSLYPTHAQDCLEAAVLAAGINERAPEPLRLLENPLDILAQIILSSCATQAAAVEDLYGLLRRSGPYRTLPRSAFDAVLGMLAGRYGNLPLSELKARIDWDEERGFIKATRGAIMALYLSGGSIPERGLYQLRHADSGAPVGELDEEFVWEASIGQCFNLGTQSWQITRIDRNEVLARTTAQSASLPPFWRAEALNRNATFSAGICDFLSAAEATLTNPEGDRKLRQHLEGELKFSSDAADALLSHLLRQRHHTGLALPHRDHLVLEHTPTAPGGYQGDGHLVQSVLHSFWGGSVNRPWAIALQGLLQDRGGVEVHVDNNCIILQHEGDLDVVSLLRSLTPEQLLPQLRRQLEGSGYFGAQFRQAAGRALLLGKANFKHRVPLWLIRQRAKKLLASVQRYEDFPIIQECWRSCLQDDFDLPRLTGLLTRLQSGDLELSEVHTRSASPFAAQAAFQQITPFMYADDQPLGKPATSLSDAALELALTGKSERPRIDPAIVRDYEEKRARRSSGYGPRDPVDAMTWIDERVLLPEQDWHQLEQLELPLERLRMVIAQQRWLVTERQARALLQASLIDSEQLFELRADARNLLQPTQRCPWTISASDPEAAAALLVAWISLFGPRTSAELTAAWPERASDEPLPFEQLLADTELLCEPLRSDVETATWCHPDSYESLLRLQRSARRSRLNPISVQAWPAFLAHWQQRPLPAGTHAVEQQLASRLELLRGYPAPLGWWLRELLPAHTDQIGVTFLQAALEEAGLHWRGLGNEVITMLAHDELDLFSSTAGATPDSAEAMVRQLFQDQHARYDFLTLADRYRDQTGEGMAAFNERLWASVWSGQLGTDSLLTLDRALRQKFSLAAPRRGVHLHRRGPGLLKGWPGNWGLLAQGKAAEDALSRLEGGRSLARVLLQRYGVITREIANRDHPAGRWQRVFPALRMMELAGEVVAGYFVDGLTGPQFADPSALKLLKDNEWAGWIAAHDPLAPTGLGLDWPGLPARRAGNYLVFSAGRLAAVVEARGRKLTFSAAQPDSAANQATLSQLARLYQHLGRTELQTINGDAPGASPWLKPLSTQLLLTADHRHFTIEPLH